MDYKESQLRANIRLKHYYGWLNRRAEDHAHERWNAYHDRIKRLRSLRQTKQRKDAIRYLQVKREEWNTQLYKIMGGGINIGGPRCGCNYCLKQQYDIQLPGDSPEDCTGLDLEDWLTEEEKELLAMEKRYYDTLTYLHDSVRQGGGPAEK